MITSNYALEACDDYLSAHVKHIMDELPVIRILTTTYTNYHGVMNA